MYYVLIGLSGVLINILVKLSTLEELKKTFSFKVWIKKNKFRTLLSIVGTVAYVLVKMKSGNISYEEAFFVGLSIDAIIKERLKEPLNNEEK